MKLVFALGNPGNAYNFTRHNLAFLTLDFWLKTRQLDWNPHPKFHSVYLKFDDLILVKPQTFYNDVGSALVEWKNFYKLANTDLLVLADDFNLPFGALRYRASGSAGGNNGLKSIISALNTTDFPRLRLGTDNSELRKRLGDVDFVLSRFTEDEKSQLPQFLTAAVQALQTHLPRSCLWQRCFPQCRPSVPDG